MCDRFYTSNNVRCNQVTDLHDVGSITNLW